MSQYYPEFKNSSTQERVKFQQEMETSGEFYLCKVPTPVILIDLDLDLLVNCKFTGNPFTLFLFLFGGAVLLVTFQFWRQKLGYWQKKAPHTHFSVASAMGVSLLVCLVCSVCLLSKHVS